MDVFRGFGEQYPQVFSHRPISTAHLSDLSDFDFEILAESREAEERKVKAGPAV